MRGICKQKCNMTIPLFYWTLACGFLEWPWRTTHTEGYYFHKRDEMENSWKVNFHNVVSPIALSQCSFASSQQDTRIKSHRQTVVYCVTKLLVYSWRNYFLMYYIKQLTASETTQHRLVKLLANNELNKVWKQFWFWPNLRLYPGINLDSMKETVRNLRQESRCLQNDSNQTAGEYQIQSSPLQSTFLVSTITNVHIWGITRSTRMVLWN